VPHHSITPKGKMGWAGRPLITASRKLVWPSFLLTCARNLTFGLRSSTHAHRARIVVSRTGDSCIQLKSRGVTLWPFLMPSISIPSYVIAVIRCTVKSFHPLHGFRSCCESLLVQDARRCVGLPLPILDDSRRMAPIRRYLRISKYSVLECRIFLENPADGPRWLLNPQDPALPRVFEAIRPLVLPKLREENERAKGKGKKKKSVKDVVTQGR
jgi:hypothetical protein